MAETVSTDVLERTIAHSQTRTPAPSATDLVTELLALEKQSKRAKQRYRYSQLLGTWRLGFTTGTVKTRKQAGTVLGAGRFLPRVVNIQLRYEATDVEAGQGKADNSVGLGALRLQLSGPTQYWPQTNSLAFDFTHLRLSVGDFQLYQQSIRGGAERAAAFYTETLKGQAFFSYFLVTPTCLAARGRGGGLALWIRKQP